MLFRIAGLLGRTGDRVSGGSGGTVGIFHTTGPVFSPGFGVCHLPSALALFTSVFSSPRKPGRENKRFQGQLCQEGSLDISVPRVSIESCPHLDLMVSPHCDLGARALAVLYKGCMQRAPAQDFLNRVEAGLILRDFSETKAAPPFL